jgi:K+-transporting ATPase ATPase C chain
MKMMVRPASRSDTLLLDKTGTITLGNRQAAAFLNDRIKGDVDKLKAENPSTAVPIDLVTASASGLDPDISPEAALFQVPRVAKARNIPEERIRRMIAERTQESFAGLLGEPRVNVLALNLALDAASR